MYRKLGMIDMNFFLFFLVFLCKSRNDKDKTHEKKILCQQMVQTCAALDSSPHQLTKKTSSGSSVSFSSEDAAPTVSLCAK